MMDWEKPARRMTPDELATSEIRRALAAIRERAARELLRRGDMCHDTRMRLKREESRLRAAYGDDPDPVPEGVA